VHDMVRRCFPYLVLALQNLKATLPERESEQAIELSALDASLSMMSKDMYSLVPSLAVIAGILTTL